MTKKKMGQIEKLEQKLGIGLVALYKAVKNGFYVKGCEGKQYIDYEYPRLESALFEHQELFYGHEYHCDYVKLSDYGKTWALTEEELE